jgi:4-diphosphocytidyl-2-C-methyl-D-erythritol kinase
MLITREATNWEVVVPSKLNLFLEVLGKRTDGYHSLDTMMLAINLCDRLRLSRARDHKLSLRIVPSTENGFQHLSEQDNAWKIPGDQTNLVVRALEAVRKKYGINEGMNIELVKGIPSQAGLGGGSADAAGALVGAMLVWLGEFRLEDAAELASGLGSDINFFIEGRGAGAGQENWLARCRGRGEQITPIRSNWSIDFVVVHPPQGCSTQNVFRRLAESNTGSDQRHSVDAVVQAMEHQDRAALTKKLFNRLGDPAAMENPWIDRIRKIFAEETQVVRSCVSGSGSSVFAVVESAERATKLAEQISKKYPLRAYAVRSWQTPTIGEQISTLLGR